MSGPAWLFDTAARLDTRTAYRVRTDEGWRATSWAQYAEQVRTASRALLSLGVGPADRVAILGFNRPEWAIMAFGAMALGAIPAGIYWTSSTRDIEYILNHSQARVLLVESRAQLDKVLAGRPSAALQKIVFMQGEAGTPEVMSWAQFMSAGRGQPELNQALEGHLASIRPHHTGTLIYTSGTTGPAKAVALSHHNLTWTVQALMSALAATPDDRVLSYLPFAHIAEQLACLHAQAQAGFQVSYARSMETLGEHLKEVHPTIFFGVPRVWEKMQAAIEDKLAQATGVKAVLAGWAMSVARRWHEADLAGRPTSAWLDLQLALARRLVLGKVKAALGFDQARMLSSGAAPIAPDKLRFFLGLDLVIREVYGQSEASGPTTLNLPGATRIGSVGRSLPGMDVRVADDGELMLRGPHIFQCYAGQPEATADTMDGDWLRTGDLGRIDADGYVYITGRKKDLIITSGGKNISPANIEADLMDSALIEHAVVCGDGRHYLSALITLDPVGLHTWCQQQGLSESQARQGPHPALLAALQDNVDRVNGHGARVAHVRKFRVLPQSLTVEGGELTPTMKVKRKVVLERQQALIEAMYAEDAPV